MQQKLHPIYRSVTGYSKKEDAEKDLTSYQLMKRNVGVHDEVTVEQLAKLSEQGYTITFGKINSTKNDGLVKADVLGIDIDNEDGDKNRLPDEYYLTPEEAITLAKEAGLAPAFVYESFSNKPEHRKFHLVFVVDEFLDKETRPQVMAALMSVFTKNGVCLCDRKCSNNTRLFFGGKRLVYTDFDAKNSRTSILTSKKEYNHYASSIKGGKSPSASFEGGDHSYDANDGEYYTSSPEIDCIKNRDAAGLRKLLAQKDFQYNYDLDIAGVQPVNKPDAFTFLASLPLAEILGVGSQTRCLLKGHVDRTPSAFIGEYKGKYRYRCFGCGSYVDNDGNNRVKAYDLISLVMAWADWTTRDAVDFLAEALNVEFESKWQIEMKKELEYSRRYMQSKQWEERFPYAAHVLKKGNRSFGIAIELLIYASDHINHESLALCGRPTFFLGKEKLSKLLQDKGMTQGTGITSCYNKLNDLRRWGFIVDAKDSDLKPEVLEKAQKLHAKNLEKNKGHKYRQNFYIIPALTDAKWQEIEDNIRAEKEGNYRRSHRSVEQTKNFDADVAERVYVQTDTKVKATKTSKFEQKAIQIAKDLLDQQGFFSEGDLKKQLRGYSDKKKDVLMINTMPLLVKELHVSKQRVNKETRSKYSIDSFYPSGSFVYVPR